MERRTSIARFFLSTALVAALVCPAGFATAGPAKKSATKTEAKAAPEAKPAAEASAAAAPSQEEMMAAMMKNAAPGPEHAALNPLVGSWKTTTKMWNAPGTEPTVSAGTCERAWTMGNRYLVANYKGVFSQMPFEGMEVLGYDNMKKQYVSSWVDNMGTGIMMSQGGAMDPSTKTFSLGGNMVDPATGKEMTTREVTNIVDNNTYVMSMFANVGGQEMKMMEITFSRVK